jgi:hypothetical protein
MAQLLPVIFGIPLFGFWLWMLVDMTNNKYITRASKNNWILAFILLNIFGAGWYYLVEYRPRNL